MINETLILDKCYLSSNTLSLDCLYKNICPLINNSIHNKIVLFIIIGFALFIICLLINRFGKYVPLKYFKEEKNRLDLEIQILNVYSFSCVILFIIMLSFGF
jgi:large-conductance mechanosensitive channel